MFPPPASGLPPYSSTPVPIAPSSSTSTSTSLPNSSATAAAAPTQRKTVRFQTDNNHNNSEEAATQRRSKSGPTAASPGAAPAAPPAVHQRDWYGATSPERSGGWASGVLHAAAGAATFATGSSSSPHANGNSSGSSSNSNGNGSVNSAPSSGPSGHDGGGGGGGGDTDYNNGHGHGSSGNDGQIARPTLLQPRVAVVLGLPSLWHLPLFACRSLSVCPAIWWSLGIFIRLLTQLHALAVARGGFGEFDANGGSGGTTTMTTSTTTTPGAFTNGGLGIHDRSAGLSLQSRLKLTETALAMIWCGASAYLSFFFTDCLMSRWLLNYTPQATIVRLLAINALNGYLTSWVIYLMGSGGDSRLLLPAWVAIAAILTGLYHGTQRKINIRKETSISISVFSGASFISMVSLLAQLYWDRPEYVDVPVVALARRVCTETARVAGNVFDIGNITMDLY